MIWESVAWVALAVGAVPLLRLVETPLRSRWPTVWPAVQVLAPWIIGLGPAYLALATGAVLERSFGLYGRAGIAGWVVSTLFCGGVLAAVWWRREKLAAFASGSDLALAFLDEPRWALYRAAGLLWLGTWGLLMGFALGGIEWMLSCQPWLEERRRDRTTWLTLTRLGGSSLLFALTGNFWLTLLSQAAGWAIVGAHDPSTGESL